MVGWHHLLNEHEFEQTPGDSEGQGSLVCCGPWDHRVGHNLAPKQQWQYCMDFPGGTCGKESPCQCRRPKRCQFDPLGGEDPLEDGMATHSSILAWRIPWTEEPGKLQSIGSQEVGHD